TYTVDAFDAAGNHSAQSASVNAQVGDATAPSVPAGLTATAGATIQQVSLSWSASTDNVGVTGYTIYRDGTQLGTVSGSTLSFLDNTVAGLTSYSYTVDAFDAAGNHSAQSAAAAVTTPQISYLNWYDQASPGMFNDNIHLLNPSTTSANVTVAVPGAANQSATVAPGAGTYVTFPAGVIGGPVTVTSDQPILASQRVQFYSSFNEVWAQGAAQASTTSYLNWYDKASPGMNNDNIHLMNPGGSTATVTVTLPGATTQILDVAAGP